MKNNFKEQENLLRFIYFLSFTCTLKKNAVNFIARVCVRSRTDVIGSHKYTIRLTA